MREITQFDPSVGSGIMETNGVNTNEQLMLYNDSIYRLRLHFNDGSIGIIPALWNKDYIIPTVPMGKVKWEVIDSLSIANNPSLMVYGEIYEPDEHVASVNASMQRSVVSSIPGGISANVSVLDNTNSADGTNVITIADSLGNTLTLDNNGTMSLKAKVGVSLINILTVLLTDNPLVQMLANGHMLENLGNEKIDGTLQVLGATTLAALTTTGATNLAGLTATGASTLGAAGVLAHILGTLTVEQVATFTGNIVANGGMNINTIRDDVNGNTGMNLNAGDGTVSFPAGVKPDKAGNVINGSVGGNVTLYTPVWGSGLKVGIVAFASFNQGAAQVTINMPTTMARGYFYMGNLGGFMQVGVGTAGGIGGMVLSTTLGNATAGGGAANSHTLGAFSNSLGEIVATVGQVIINNGTNAGAVSGVFAFAGV